MAALTKEISLETEKVPKKFPATVLSSFLGAGRFDYLLIESTGISEPLPVAETFTFADEEGRSLADVAVLNKIDLVEPRDLGRLHNILKTLNPDAKIVHAHFRNIPVNEILNTGRFIRGDFGI
jgi:G3E family GTPase